MKERYFVEDAKLHKIALPRGKKNCSVPTQLWNVSASPKIQILLLQHYHDRLGHYATERMF